jgi:hypothetical protein
MKAPEMQNAVIVFTEPNGMMQVMDLKGDILPRVIKTTVEQHYKELSIVTAVMYCNVVRNEEDARNMLAAHKSGRAGGSIPAADTEFIANKNSEKISQCIEAGNADEAIILYHKAVKWNHLDIKLEPDQVVRLMGLLDTPRLQEKVLTEWYIQAIDMATAEGHLDKVLLLLKYAWTFDIPLIVKAISVIPQPSVKEKEDAQKDSLPHLNPIKKDIVDMFDSLTEAELLAVEKIDEAVKKLQPGEYSKQKVGDVVYTKALADYYKEQGVDIKMFSYNVISIVKVDKKR